MAFYNSVNPEDMTVCPYDDTHMIRNKKRQFHISKCRKNFTLMDMITCPYNATHVYPKQEHQYHLTHCIDRGVIDQDLMYETPELKTLWAQNGYSGNCQLPTYENHVEPSESWDIEPCDSGYKYPGYRCAQPERLPREEPLVLMPETPSDIERILEERRKHRQTNAPKDFLQSIAAGRGSGTSPRVAAPVGRGRGSFPRTPHSNHSQSQLSQINKSEKFSVTCQTQHSTGTRPQRLLSTDVTTAGNETQPTRYATNTSAFALPGIGRGIRPTNNRVTGNS